MPPSPSVLSQTAFNVVFLHFKGQGKLLLPPSPVVLQNLYQRMANACHIQFATPHPKLGSPGTKTATKLVRPKTNLFAEIGPIHYFSSPLQIVINCNSTAVIEKIHHVAHAVSVPSSTAFLLLACNI